MRPLAFVLLVACGGAKQPDPVGSPTPVQEANAPIPDASPRDAAVPPPELANADPLTMRYVHVGLIDFQAGAEVLELRRHDHAAWLQVHYYPLDRGSTTAESPAIGSTDAYIGTIADPSREPVRIQFDTFALSCGSVIVPVATATARRVASPGADECGDQGRWSPMTKPMPAKVLRCEVTSGTTSFAPAAPHLAFGAAPGIEYAFANDDCLQGGGWRAVTTAGTFEAVRTP